MTRVRPPLFPDPAAAPGDCAPVIARWEAVLARSPRLRPWLEQMIERRRILLHESARGSIERALWLDLERWLGQFESLPQFAVSAISTTLEEKERPPRAAPDLGAIALPDSPERAASDREALLADPAFALAFHCVEVRLRPALPASPPHQVWFGLLRASRTPRPLLTPEVAIGLVLRLLGAGWNELPAAARQAALRLFHATAGDLRAAERVRQICQALPREWGVVPEAFVSSADRARSGLEEACALCARIAASARPTQRGGLSVLAVDGPARASPEELAAVGETARRFSQITGLRRLLSLL